MTELIALDLDGTALRPDNTVSDKTRQAVLRARQQGCHMVVATGRISTEAREFAEKMGADDLMVTSGGAALSSVQYGGSTMRLSMPWEAAVRAAAVVERIGLTAMVYVDDRLLITPYDEMMFGRYKSNEGYLAAKQVEPSVAEYIAREHISVDKIFVRSTVETQLAGARRQLETIAGVRVMSSASDNLEIVSPLADKGTALAMLCRALGTDLSHAAAVGDSENDLEMLRAVEMPVAMGNASDEVKLICRMVTGTNAEDGAAQAIGRLLGWEP